MSHNLHTDNTINVHDIALVYIDKENNYSNETKNIL